METKTRKYSLSTIGEILAKDPFDLFICSSSFEERCLSIANEIKLENSSKALIVENVDLHEHVGNNARKLKEIFGEKGNIIETRTDKPLLTADSLDVGITTTIQSRHVGSILIDVTSFTHESLLILLRLIQLRHPDALLRGVYINASQYSVGDDVSKKWLSRGIDEVRPILGFPGNILPSRKNHLIIIVGYEYERAAGIIDALEPNSIALGYGRSGSATTDKDKEANEYYMQLVKDMASSFEDINTFEISCNDPHSTEIEINKQIASAEGNNILIAPMNNKLSTIGVALAAINNVDAQICYAQALTYNYSNYSLPGSECYLFNLNIC